MRVLFAWEEGAHLGHTTRLGALAAALRERGVALTWAAPQHRAAALRALAHPGEQVLVLRVERAAPARWQLPLSYADILVSLGFSGTEPLKAKLSPWLALMKSCRPDLVVLDYAPVALLAAYVCGVRAVQVSNGFDTPPAHCPPFGYRMRGPWAAQQNERLAATVQTAIAAVAAGNKGLAGMLNHPLRLLDVCPASDPYGHLRQEAGERLVYVGPLGSPPKAETPHWRGPPGAPRVFAYLRGPQARLVAEAAHGLWLNTICVWPDASDEDLRMLSTGTTEVRRALVDGAAAVAEADAVVNYGSSGLVTQTLLAGKPQLMLPADVEKWLISRRVADAGAGVMLNDGNSLEVSGALAATISGIGVANARCADIARRQRSQLRGVAGVLNELL